MVLSGYRHLTGLADLTNPLPVLYRRPPIYNQQRGIISVVVRVYRRH